MCGSSPPGSMITASLVSPHASTVQLHWNGPAGNVSRSSTGDVYPMWPGQHGVIARARGRCAGPSAAAWLRGRPEGMAVARPMPVRPMRRWIVLAAVAVAGCGGGSRGREVARPGTSGTAELPLCAVSDADRVELTDADRATAGPDLDALLGRTIAAVGVRGAPTLADAPAAELLLRPGAKLARAAIDDQLRRLWRGGPRDDARAPV